MKELTLENICAGCSLRRLPKEQLAQASIKYPSCGNMSMLEYTQECLERGVPPQAVTADLAYIYRAYPEQAQAVIQCIGRQAAASDCGVDPNN